MDIPVNIVVSDDCSVDDTVIISRGILKDRQSIILTSGVNTGVGLNRQRAIEKTDSSHIMFLDSDDYIEKIDSKDGEYVASPFADITILSRAIPSRMEKQIAFETELCKISNAGNNQIEPLLTAIMDQSVILECWGMIFDRSLIEKNSISFFDARIGEDAMFMLEYLSTANDWKYIAGLKVIKSAGMGLSRGIGESIRDDFVMALYNATLLLTSQSISSSRIKSKYIRFNIDNYINFIAVQHFYKSLNAISSSKHKKAEIPSIKLEYPEIFNNNLLEITTYSDQIDLLSSLYYTFLEDIGNHNSLENICIWFASPRTFVFCEALSMIYTKSITCIIDDHREGEYITNYGSCSIPIISLSAASKLNNLNHPLVLVCSDSLSLSSRVIKRTKSMIPENHILELTV